eukprot:TRINITY_DN26707_c0_g1_i1.p2 TRINITY_DN26707_c0_g1~~TRINITY_DN26707_c0_g1_i1.p2  ORF type:complete len:102 (-),score=27.60 TRINITY_DN26707_c0_g1_i1:145-450(-)
MLRRPPRSTQGVSSAASDVYKRQVSTQSTWVLRTVRKKPIIPCKQNETKAGFEIRKTFSSRIFSASSSVKMGTSEQDKSSCLLYTSPSPRDLSTSRMPSSA